MHTKAIVEFLFKVKKNLVQKLHSLHDLIKTVSKLHFIYTDLRLVSF